MATDEAAQCSATETDAPESAPTNDAPESAPTDDTHASDDVLLMPEPGPQRKKTFLYVCPLCFGFVNLIS